FSSRRRHTRFSRDWSSDVCSSDLLLDLDRLDGRADGALLLGELAGAVVARGGVVSHQMSRNLVSFAFCTMNCLRSSTTSPMRVEIGRASCRERVWRAVDGGALDI